MGRGRGILSRDDEDDRGCARLDVQRLQGMDDA